MSDANRTLIRGLYEALDRHDGEAMAACYAPGATFRDPAFGLLEGEQPGDMWRMLTSRSEDLKVELAGHNADAASGSAHWIARYTFSTGRAVVNDVQARFRFADGLIVEHVDDFSFRAWSAQALGPVGLLVGWAPPFQLVFRSGARRQLAKFRSERQG